MIVKPAAIVYWAIGVIKFTLNEIRFPLKKSEKRVFVMTFIKYAWYRSIFCFKYFDNYLH